jgi:hypothetical protein
MEQVWTWIHYLREHPAAAVGVVAAVVVLYKLLNVKPKLARDADKRMAEIRDERGDIYNKVRPPQ